ncbi:granzyme A-like [Takifugu rubripes]|uniref:granzyme A-like n=1 Tax=Takifugu rubripes TaxID=31033 RepID=UPI00114571F8|nr:granzyme A-like [Takifugu rubripes]
MFPSAVYVPHRNHTLLSRTHKSKCVHQCGFQCLTSKRDQKRCSPRRVLSSSPTNGAVNQPSDVLMSVNVTVVDRKKCSKYYSPEPVITKAMICAGSENKDACQGDSGGPLLCNGALVGVTSFGRGCGRVPGVYAYITEEHLRWIKKIIRTSEMQE